MIHQDCADRIMAFGDNESIRRGLIDMFNAISNEADMKEVPSSTLVINFYDEQCNLKSGDWAAELMLVVRKVEDEQHS